MTRSGSPAITFVGELNPYGSDPRLALHPDPPHATGGRLCKVLGLDPDSYLTAYKRANLCERRWDPRAALVAVERLDWWRAVGYDRRTPARGYVLLGAKVADAFGFPTTPFRQWQRGSAYYLTLPHPSGLCRVWNQPGAAERARREFRRLRVEMSIYPGFQG